MTLLCIASNPELLTTAEGLRWLIGYSRAICDDHDCGLSVAQVLDSLKWDMDMVLDEYHKQAQFLPPPAYQYTTTELPF